MNPDINPGVDEICNDTLDNDCDGLADGMDPDCAGSGGDESSGCGCRLAGAGAPAGIPGLAVLAVLAVLGMRRRSR